MVDAIYCGPTPLQPGNVCKKFVGMWHNSLAPKLMQQLITRGTNANTGQTKIAQKVPVA